MEKTLAPRPLRRASRRLMIKIGCSMAVLASGSWATYHFTQGAGAADSSVKAHSATTTETQLNGDELKQLFASPPPKSPEVSATSDRYTLASASSSPKTVADPQSGQHTATPATDSAASPTNLGDRYASVAVQAAPSSELTPAPEPEPSDESQPEIAEQPVARGQGPENYNPLRSSARNLAASTAAAIPITLKAASKPAASSPGEMFAGGQAQPTQSAASSASDRYSQSKVESPQPTPAAPPINYGPSAETVTGQLPAPAYQMQPEPTVAAPPQPTLAGRTPLTASPAMGLAAAASSTPTPTPGLTNAPGTGRPGERLLEGLQSPSVTIHKLAPAEIQVGRRCTFAIRIQNTGQRTAQSVQVHDEIPQGMDLVGTSPRASVSGSQVIWDIGALSVGEERTVEMELIPTEEGELGSVASVSFATQASAKARCTRPELALRLTSKPQVHAGQQHLVQVELSNPGSGEATGVMLLETVPEGISHEAGPALEFEVGTLAPGETRKLDLWLTAESAGKIDNVMTARADAGLQVQSGCEFEVIAPELQVSIDGPKKRYLERPATYQVSIDNPGTATAKEVQLVSHLPKGLQFVSANNMGEYDASSHSVHWSLAELPAKERGTVELVALPIETGEHTLQISSKAQQGLEDEAETHVSVDGIVALMFDVKDLESPVEIGGETTYEIRVVNQGSKAATNVQVGAILPQGMRPLSGQGETRHAIQGEKVIFTPLAQLAPKAESVFRIQAQGLRAGDQRVRVQVVSDEVRQPITKEVSTRVYADQ